jgi:FKBP-type peptidyl-prolyl cis-trans isomerase FklB
MGAGVGARKEPATLRWFAETPEQCENASMRKSTICAAIVLAACMMLGWNAAAQQTPAASSQQAPAATTQTTPPAKAPQAGATKAPATAARKAPPAKAPASLTLTTPKDKASYAIGVNIGRGLHRDSVDVDPNILIQGLKDALAGGKLLLSDDEAKAALTALQADVNKRQQEKAQVAGDANKKEGEEFLAANKTKDGVVTLPSGLQYKILKVGTGPKPAATDSVVCNYRGTLINGTEFDSSYKRGQPATFGVSQVIHGWTEALQLMPVGSKWQLFIPAEMAYGPRGAGADIGPNATLIFEVELLSIESKSK